MGLEGATSTGHVTTNERQSSLSRIPVDISLEGLLQSHGQVLLHLVITNKPPVHSCSLSPTCIESSPQSSTSKMKIIVPFVTTVCGVQHLKVVTTLESEQIAIKVLHLGPVSPIHTTTRQAKEGAFSQVTQVTTISKSKRLKCSELTFKISQNLCLKLNTIKMNSNPFLIDTNHKSILTS